MFGPFQAAALEELPNTSTSSRSAPSPGTKPSKKARLLFHWTTRAVADALQRGEIKYAPPGEDQHGAWAGSGFYTADKFDRWTNDTRADALVVLEHDHRLRVIGPEAIDRGRPFPTVAEAAQRGIDGYEDDDQLVLYNRAHVRVLNEAEAAPIIRAELRRLSRGRTSWQNLKAVARIAGRYLPADEAVHTVLRALPEGLTGRDRSRRFRQEAALAIDLLTDLPSRRGLLEAARIALHPNNPSGPSSLRAALARPSPAPELAASRAALASVVVGIRAYDDAPWHDRPADLRQRADDARYLADLEGAEPALRALFGTDAPHLDLAVARALQRPDDMDLIHERVLRESVIASSPSRPALLGLVVRDDPQSVLEVQAKLAAKPGAKRIVRALEALHRYEWDDIVDVPAAHGAKLLRYQRAFDRVIPKLRAGLKSAAHR